MNPSYNFDLKENRVLVSEGVFGDGDGECLEVVS